MGQSSKIPHRRCIVCREVDLASEMVRLVVLDGEVVLDCSRGLLRAWSDVRQQEVFPQEVLKCRAKKDRKQTEVRVDSTCTRLGAVELQSECGTKLSKLEVSAGKVSSMRERFGRGCSIHARRECVNKMVQPKLWGRVLRISGESVNRLNLTTLQETLLALISR